MAIAQEQDPYLWLENITSPQALEWVQTHNTTTMNQYCDSAFERMRTYALDILDTDARIPYVRRRGNFLYNYWRDSNHPRGLWRRTTLESYLSHSPQWDVLIDLDQLAHLDRCNWVWGGATVLSPEHTRALIALSPGGSDASVIREFDLELREFLAEGFNLPEAKTRICWETPDSVLVGTDFGPGSLTASGYPRIIKRWKRYQPLEEAQIIFTGQSTDVSVGAGRDRTPGFERTFISRAINFFNDDVYELTDDDGLTQLDIPTDASVSVHRQWLLIELRTDWSIPHHHYQAGTLLATEYDKFLAGNRDLTVLFVPDSHSALHHYAWTQDYLLVVTLHDVASHIQVITPGTWEKLSLDGVPEHTSTTIVGTDPHTNEVFLDSSSFHQPSSLLYGHVLQGVQVIKQAPHFFDASNITVHQYFATSDDGTQIPYFVVRPENATGMTLLSGYGGFEVSNTPGYDGVLGKLWLSQGGTYVLANIRGGGEYGPQWHLQATGPGRHLVAEDFAAVARDLVERNLTTPRQLGAIGGSNGGLLMGIMLTSYPDLFGAIVCQVPLLDMRRYHRLLAGASWMAEYGNPDIPEEWEFIRQYSPYQKVHDQPTYPPVLITTSTRDDRVHPGHARKMVAALQESQQPVSYYENIEGGHGGAADNTQAAFKSALTFSFLLRHLSHAVLDPMV